MGGRKEMSLAETLARFQQRAQAYLERPGVIAGIELDDAAVALKRLLLLEGERYRQQVDALNGLAAAIRASDAGRCRELIECVDRIEID